MSSSERPQNLRKQTMQSDGADDFKRMSFSMNSKNVVGANQVSRDLLCALCQAILTEPWECKECHCRFHQVCLNKFAKETGQCPMQCKKPRFVNIKKEVEKQLQSMEFVCNNKQFGCDKILTYQEVQDHDQYCEYQPIKCQAFKICKTKCLRKDIEMHQAACPNIMVPCVYCRKKIMRVDIMRHEQEECEGTYVCSKCGMSIYKEETQKNSHNCFNALAGYLQNMLKSKDFVINVFKEEIDRKNKLVEQLLQKQEQLEEKLTKMEEILAYNDKNGTLQQPTPDTGEVLKQDQSEKLIKDDDN